MNLQEPSSRLGTLFTRIQKIVFGKPLNLEDKSIFHQISLIPFLAWVGLGADGLSSSAYGPAEAFVSIGQHRYLAIALAIVTAATVLLISAAYSRLIEAFPSGGGGYIVASKLLGPKSGVVSGSALLVDYVLTITVSIAAMGDALFSLAPVALHFWKLPCEVVAILVLIVMNLRGVKESVIALVPVFLLFVFTHIALIGSALFEGASRAQETFSNVSHDFNQGKSSLGWIGMALLFARAYSLGGGTYTGLEAVSNGLPIMREPRVKTGKRTMMYMAVSLALTASGLLIGYLLMGTSPQEGMTLNAVLAHQVSESFPFSRAFVFATLISEGAILFVAAQAGFLDGPRVLANMALDGWVPRQFSSLSERLTSQNGILLMGIAAIVALVSTKGNVGHLVVMYSINVFLTFSLSMAAMLKSTLKNRKIKIPWRSDFALFSVGFLVCFTILIVTTVEKFEDGGWITILVTGAVTALAFAIQSHYRGVANKIAAFKCPNFALETKKLKLENETGDIQKNGKTAVVLVGGFHAVGLRTIETVLTQFPNFFQNIYLISVGVVDSGTFKGLEELENLRNSLQTAHDKYRSMLGTCGISIKTKFIIDTDPIDGLEDLCLDVASEVKDAIFFAGQIIFEQEKWFYPLLHNQTSFSLQKRLQKKHLSVVILPVGEPPTIS